MKKTTITNLQSEIVKAFSDKDYDRFVYKVIDPDPILKKFHHFIFVPPIEFGFSNYPINSKIDELKNLDSKDWDHFFKKYYKTQDIDKRCFKFFKVRLEVLVGFVNFIKKFPNSQFPKDLIYNQIELYRKTEHQISREKKKVRLEIGKYWPIFGLVYWYHINENVINNEDCYVHWLPRYPSTSEIKQHFLDWEIFAIDMYASLKDFDEYENILFGDKSETEFRIYNFYNDKLIALKNKKYVTRYISFSLVKKGGGLSK